MTNRIDHHATIQAATDAYPHEPFYVPQSAARVWREIGYRSPSLHAAGWLELLYVDGFGRPCRALTTIDWLAQAYGFYAGFAHNSPMADAFEHRPFHPERTAAAAPEAMPSLPAPEMLALPAPAPALPWRKRNPERYNAYHRAYQMKRRADAKALAQAEAAADRFRFLTGRRMRKLNLSSEHRIAFRAALASATTSKEASAAYEVARSHHVPA